MSHRVHSRHSGRGSRPRGGYGLRDAALQEVREHKLERSQAHPDVGHARHRETEEVKLYFVHLTTDIFGYYKKM